VSDDQQQQAAQGNTEAAAANQEQNQQGNPPAKASENAAAAADQKPVDSKQGTPAADKSKPASAEGKPAAPAKKEGQAADEKIELKLPDGSHLKQDDVDKIASFAKEHGLSKDVAQKLLERESANLAAHNQAALDQLAEQSEAWKQEIIADKDFGGEKAAETAQLAHDVAKKFGSETFVSELERTGLGNHPELVRMLARIGRAMESGNPNRGSGLPAGSQKKSTESKLYSETTPV